MEKPLRSFRTPFSRLFTLSLLSLSATALPLTAQLTLTGETENKQPLNILLLIADDLGVEGVGAYEEPSDPPYTPRTPRIDQLAEDGVLFRNCWANPGCSPTRATMLTGRYSFRTGIGQAVHYASSLFELSPSEVGIPERLSNGYRSAALGKWHLSAANGTGLRHPKHLGFDTFRGSMKIFPGFIGDAYYNWEKIVDGETIPSTKYATSDTVDDALAFIEKTQDPWFLWVAFHAPHAPFHKPPAELHTYDLPPDVADDLALHAGAMTEALDTEIGRLLDSMDPATREKTLIIFIGDNGAPASVTVPPLDPLHSKNTVYEGGINVPLIVAGPGVVSGRQCDALVNSTDIFSTIIEIAHAEVPGGVPPLPEDSVSLTPYFENPGQSSNRQWVYAEYFEPNGLSSPVNRRTMRQERFKLIQNVHAMDGVTNEELYDLMMDPFETTNLLDFPALPTSTTVTLDILRDELERLDSATPPWHTLGEGGVVMKNAPTLSGGGVPTPGAVLSLDLAKAPANVLGMLVAGFPAADVPFSDGVIAPERRFHFPITTDTYGRFRLQATWPRRAPDVGSMVFQIVFPQIETDAQAKTVSNALRLTLN